MKTQASPSQDNGRKTVGIWDIVAAAAVIVAAAAAYFFMQSDVNGPKTAVVSADGQTVAEISLDRDGVYPIEGTDMELTVKDGGICVSHSDCPDKICEKTGYIKSGSQSIVCLPNRVSVRIISDETDDIDVVLN
ncbi:MAG: NusG domain II-containing protein [Oscillospiraceae bacterium]